VFNLQGSELVIVLLLALVVLGPEKLPDAIRKVGQFYAELKKMSSGFQDEFKSAVDEPMREMKNTASMLRDSADFTKFQDGDREEKPKSAEMGPAPDPVPTDAPESGPTTVGVADDPQLADDSKPAPFSGLSSANPRTASAAPTDDVVAANDVSVGTSTAAVGDDEPQLADDSKPPPFSGRSSAAPRPAVRPGDDGDLDDAVGDDGELTERGPGGEVDADLEPSDTDDATGRAR